LEEYLIIYIFLQGRLDILNRGTQNKMLTITRLKVKRFFGRRLTFKEQIKIADPKTKARLLEHQNRLEQANVRLAAERSRAIVQLFTEVRGILQDDREREASTKDFNERLKKLREN
jgi:hypothetical protein